MKELWYKFKHRILPAFLAKLVKGLIGALMKTCKVKIRDSEKYLKTAESEPCVVMLWHNRLVLAPTLLYKTAPHFNYGVLVSNSRDGEIISSIINSYAIGYSIRVSHNARKQALDEAINFLNKRKGVLVITPDGPRGPKYRIKKGAAYIAKASGAKVVPASWKANNYWELNSWDHLVIPKPFSTITLTFGDPIAMEHSNQLPSKQEVSILEESLHMD
ncbi:MAG: lysophospholipid acyltransferase family protein [Chlamydiota bacterium]|nr:lysophospholipid acyltransferase family protein [Chlamydiota bacterium]